MDTAGVTAAAQSDRQHQPERLSRLSRRTMAADVGSISTTEADDLMQQPTQPKSLGRVLKQSGYNSEIADTCATAGDATTADVTVTNQHVLYSMQKPCPHSALSILDCHHFPPCTALGSLSYGYVLAAAAVTPTSTSSCIRLSLPRPAACLYADHCLHVKPLAAAASAASAAGRTCDIQLCVQAMRNLQLSQMIPLISSHPQMTPYLMKELKRLEKQILLPHLSLQRSQTMLCYPGWQIALL